MTIIILLDSDMRSLRRCNGDIFNIVLEQFASISLNGLIRIGIEDNEKILMEIPLICRVESCLGFVTVWKRRSIPRTEQSEQEGYLEGFLIVLRD